MQTTMSSSQSGVDAVNEKKSHNEIISSAPATTHSLSSAPHNANNTSGNNQGATATSSKAVASSSSAAQPTAHSSAAPAAPVIPEEEAISYVNQEGDWKYRKINLFRVVRGFVSQLKPGQDLTKVSLPAECCTPYGLLEVMGSRELAMFHLTFGMNRSPDDPMERFFSALRFFFGTVRSERFDKKPWNPVLGETHITYADVVYGADGVGTTETASASSSAPTAASSSASGAKGAASSRSRTVFVGEQVSHHPPVSAICLSNEREQIQCQANVSFSVKFGGNQVTVATAGELQLVSKRFNERYELTKCLPDMVIRNVVWGKKYIMWEGEVTMTCPQTGITAYLKFKEKSSQNIVKGYIMRGESDEPLFEINGICGEKIMIHSTADKKEKVLLDLTTEPTARIHYLPKSKLAPLSSVGVWNAVNKAIVDDDMNLADKEKKVIEQAQRERAKARAELKQDFQGCYFDMSDEGMWTYKNNMDLDTVLSEGAQSMDTMLVSDSDDSSDEEFVSQEESVEPLLGSTNADSAAAASALSDADRSPITSGDEFEEGDLDDTRAPIVMSSSNLDVSSPKRRRGSTSGKTSHKPSLSTSSVTLPSSNSKKELRAEKKKAREEVKQSITKMKEEKKKGTVSAQLLEGQVYAGWCKVRNVMKKWKDRYLVVLPGRLVIFRSPKEAASSSASGLIQLQGCDVRPRPSKKDGACFKVFSLNQYPIYSRQGLKGETISSALLPVGSDYLILRCADPTYMNIWIEKIRQCIPDWEKNKNLIKAAGDLEDTEEDSDDESLGEDSEIEMPASPSSSSVPSLITPAAIHSGPNSERQGSPSITTEDILGQIAQLYKMTRKVSQRQRKNTETLEEVKTKQAETLETVKKSASASSVAAVARRNPFEKKHSEVHSAAAEPASGLAGKIKAQLDVKTIVLLLVNLFVLYLYFTSGSAVTIPATAGGATGTTATAGKGAATSAKKA